MNRVDTFIVRTLLVPALLMLVPDWTWWPGKVPVPTVGLPPYYTGGAAEDVSWQAIGGESAAATDAGIEVVTRAIRRSWADSCGSSEDADGEERLPPPLAGQAGVEDSDEMYRRL